MVSPLDKSGGDIRGIEGNEVDSRSGITKPAGDNGGGVVEASLDGNRITYVSAASFGNGQGAPIGSQYVSALGPDGWLTQNLTTPTNNQVYPPGGAGTPYDAFSMDLARGLEFGGVGGFQVGHPVESPPLGGAPAGYENYLINEIHYPGDPKEASLVSILNEVPSQPSDKFELEFLGATPDLSHVILASGAKLAPEAIEAEYDRGSHTKNMYEWERATGQFQPVNILPDGTPQPAAELLLGGNGGATDHAISNDGSQVIWTTNTGLYVREGIGTPKARTVQADASRGPGSSGGGWFLTANTLSGTGSKVFFADNNRLTSNSTATSGSFGDLYEFEPNNGPTGTLTDLTVESEGGGSAEVQGALGANEDGSYLYFVARGHLAPNAPHGGDNLYEWHEGEPLRFIAALSGNDSNTSGTKALGVAFDWESHLGLRTTRVSHDGTRLLFMSELSLTGYDNRVITGSGCGRNGFGEPLPPNCEEVFMFDASKPVSDANPVCISCNPNGDRPSGPSGISGGTEFLTNEALYDSRALSEDGSRVFFDSADGLVPQDTNGREDVYEYENGHVYLLSSGTSDESASFVDASANGSDVFFVTRAQLVAQDTDQLMDLYDARVPHVPGEQVDLPGQSPVVPCEGEGCRGASSGEPGYNVPSSVLFTGPGNVAPGTPKPGAKHRAKKVKPKKRRKRARHARRANVRRASRALAGADVGSTRGR